MFFNDCSKWRPQRDSNPCYRRERAIKRLELTFLIHLKSSLIENKIMHHITSQIQDLRGATGAKLEQMEHHFPFRFLRRSRTSRGVKPSFSASTTRSPHDGPLPGETTESNSEGVSSRSFILENVSRATRIVGCE